MQRQTEKAVLIYLNSDTSEDFLIVLTANQSERRKLTTALHAFDKLNAEFANLYQWLTDRKFKILPTEILRLPLS